MREELVLINTVRTLVDVFASLCAELLPPYGSRNPALRTTTYHKIFTPAAG